MTELNGARILEDIEKNYQFYFFLFSTFVIFMGAIRLFGKRSWHDWEKLRRENRKLPVASLMSLGGSSDQLFTYSSLFKGGLVGVIVVTILLLYVVFLVEFIYGMDLRPLSQNDILTNVRIFLNIPIIGVAAYIIILFSFRSKLRTILKRLFATITMFVTIILSTIFVISIYYYIMILVKNPEVVIFIEVLILAFMSLSLSYTLGSTAGIKAADPSLTYPLVSVEVIHGTMIDQAWLYERTNSDYRLVTRSGSNHIIPATNVKEINALPSGA